jgi:type IV pilus assembly protein PilQ
VAHKLLILILIFGLLFTNPVLMHAQEKGDEAPAVPEAAAVSSSGGIADDLKGGEEAVATAAPAAQEDEDTVPAPAPQDDSLPVVVEGYEPPDVGTAQEEEEAVAAPAAQEEVVAAPAPQDNSLPPVAEGYEPPGAETPQEEEEAAPAPEEKTKEPPKEAAAESAPKEEAQNAEEDASAVQAGNVTVNFKGADIRTVLAYIAEVSGVDIVPAPDVKGIVDLKLTNKPWKVALDIILRNYGYSYEREGDIIRVVTIDKLKQEEPTTHAFNLNYSNCKDVSESIKNILSEKGKVTSDERTNTIVVTDIPTNIYKIKQVVERLDRRTQQVLIEARIIETVLDDTEKLGIDWSMKFSISGAKRPITFPFDNMKVPFGKKQNIMEYFPVVNSGNQVESTSAVIGGATTQTTTNSSDFPAAGDAYPIFPFPFAQTSDFQFGTLDFSEFRAVLELLKQRANTDIVSNPRIATLNNSQAIINVGQTLNMPTYERNSTTGKMEITGYTAKDLGILLQVTPHINDNGEIVVDLLPTISDLLRYDTLDRASGVVAPVFSQRIAKTQVMIKDGETIFIGGLIKENDIDSKKKLPFLGDLFGDIPIVGLLFTKKETTKQKTELIFFITVNVMSYDRPVKGAPVASEIYAPKYTDIPPSNVSIKKKLDRKDR